LPFSRCHFAIPLCRAVVPLPFFHSVATIAIAGENGNAGNVFPYIYRVEVNRTLIGCPPMAERQKIGFDPIAMERQLRHNGRWKRQWHNRFFSRKQRNSYGAYVILMEFT